MIKEFWLLILKSRKLKFSCETVVAQSPKTDEFPLNGIFANGTNCSFIVLIPVVKDPKHLVHFRLI